MQCEAICLQPPLLFSMERWAPVVGVGLFCLCASVGPERETGRDEGCFVMCPSINIRWHEDTGGERKIKGSLVLVQRRSLNKYIFTQIFSPLMISGCVSGELVSL